MRQAASIDNSKMHNTSLNIITATVCYASGAYSIDKFLSNQSKIQELYPASRLIIATAERDYKSQLINMLANYRLNTEVFYYDIEKPDFARDRVWNITCGREAIRKYFLSRETAEYMLFLDSDMVFDPSIISKMLTEIKGYDLVFSGYKLKKHGSGLSGCGCIMLRREVLEKIVFRCIEFKNGQVIYEDNLLEMDAYKHHFRIKRGFFINIKHYLSAEQYKSQAPQEVTLLRKIINNSLFRYLIIWLSIRVEFNIPWYLKRLVSLFAS